jgi:hypothetical protein
VHLIQPQIELRDRLYRDPPLDLINPAGQGIQAATEAIIVQELAVDTAAGAERPALGPLQDAVHRSRTGEAVRDDREHDLAVRQPGVAPRGSQLFHDLEHLEAAEVRRDQG